MKKNVTLILLLTFFTLLLPSCGKDNNSRIDETFVEENQSQLAEYQLGIYENILSGNEEKIGSKQYFDGQLDPSGYMMYDIQAGYAYIHLDVGSDQYINIRLNNEPISGVEASNILIPGLEEFYGLPGRFNLQYVGNDEQSGQPLCVVDNFVIQDKTYSIESFVTIKGTIKDPALIGENLSLETPYNGSLDITLAEVLKGKEAETVINKTNSRYHTKEGKTLILSKFQVNNTGMYNAPVEINKYMFKYSNDDYVAKDIPTLYANVENELDFTLYDGIGGEGWIGFEVDDDFSKIYLILDDILWFSVI